MRRIERSCIDMDVNPYRIVAECACFAQFANDFLQRFDVLILANRADQLHTVITSGADLAAILGQTQDADGVVYAGEDDEPPYMAIGFRAKKANGMYKVDSCICLYVNPPDKLGCYLSPTHSPEWTRALSYAAQISMFSNIATK